MTDCAKSGPRWINEESFPSVVQERGPFGYRSLMFEIS